MGVQLEDTFAEVLEKRIGRKVLNFGSAAHFGPVQAEILYRTLASKFPHNEIIYFFTKELVFRAVFIEYTKVEPHNDRIHKHEPI